MLKRFVLVAAASLAAAALAPAQTVAPPNVPSDLRPPSGNVAFLKAYAVGTQNYVCLPATSGLAWTFQGPQATVFLKFQWLNTEALQQVATHYLSPNPKEPGTPARATWQSSLDSSAVWAKKIAETSDSAYVAKGAIPWFLLQAVGTERGPLGGAMLAKTTYVQRVNTTGGTVSDTACTQPGAIQFVPYTAEYVFWEPADAR